MLGYVLLLVAALVVVVLAVLIRRAPPVSKPPPGFGAVRARWRAVADEARRIPERKDPVVRQRKDWGSSLKAFVARLGDNSAWIRAWACDGSWYNYPLITDGRPVPGRTAELCPATSRLLAGVKGVRVAGFSKVKAGGRIERHTDGPTGCLALHLCLIGRSELRVGGQVHVQEPGKVIVFDPEEEHEVHNSGEQDRTLLFVNFPKPAGGR